MNFTSAPLKATADRLVQQLQRAEHVARSSDEAVENDGFHQGAEHSIRGDDDEVVLDGFERVVQLDNYSSGAQSAFIGKARSLERTLTLLGTDENGLGIRAMAKLVRARGLKAKRVENGTKNIERASDDGHPVLVLLDDEGHWACVYGYGKGRTYLADPSPMNSLGVVVNWPTFKGRRTGQGAWRRALTGQLCGEDNEGERQ